MSFVIGKQILNCKPDFSGLTKYLRVPFKTKGPFEAHTRTLCNL